MRSRGWSSPAPYHDSRQECNLQQSPSTFARLALSFSPPERFSIDSNSGEFLSNQTLHDIFNALGNIGRQRPWTRLPQDVQCAALVEHIKAGSISLPIKMNTDDGF